MGARLWYCAGRQRIPSARRDCRRRAVLMRTDTGIFVAPPRSGKRLRSWPSRCCGASAIANGAARHSRPNKCGLCLRPSSGLNPPIPLVNPPFLRSMTRPSAPCARSLSPKTPGNFPSVPFAPRNPRERSIRQRQGVARPLNRPEFESQPRIGLCISASVSLCDGILNLRFVVWPSRCPDRGSRKVSRASLQKKLRPLRFGKPAGAVPTRCSPLSPKPGQAAAFQGPIPAPPLASLFVQARRKHSPMATPQPQITTFKSEMPRFRPRSSPACRG